MAAPTTSGSSSRRGFRRFYRRRFLNRPRHHQGAHVIADVQVERWPDQAAYVSADVHLADCNRCITLDFDASTRAEATNALRKVAVLRVVLADFEVALQEAVRDAGLER